MGITYYTQRAIDLIQLATLPPQDSLLTYQYQNISRVKNEGWEFEGRLPLGPVQLAATYSITSSTIEQLPANYPPGGYQVGDGILGTPHTVAGTTVTYSPDPRTTLSASLTHLGHWINTDYVALYGYYFGGQSYLGSDRAYWIEYPTVTKFTVAVSQKLTNNLTAFLRAENVGNNQRYEQDNSLIAPRSRTVLVGANLRN